MKIKTPEPFKIEKIEKISGFAAEDVEAGETVKIIYRGTFTSDQKEFYLYINQISSLFLQKFNAIDFTYSFLIIIHNDLSTDIYLNNIPAIVKIIGKRDIKAGEFISSKDIADIIELKFFGIDITETDNIIYCFKKGWKFGLFFNFTKNATNKKLDIQNTYYRFGNLYKYLTYED
ncbi:MAG: hypothetical protein ACTSRP_21120 [Candidatus Helarchaeota archaeon]